MRAKACKIIFAIAISIMLALFSGCYEYKQFETYHLKIEEAYAQAMALGYKESEEVFAGKLDISENKLILSVEAKNGNLIVSFSDSTTLDLGKVSQSSDTDDNLQNNHQHTFAKELSYGDAYHYYKATCVHDGLIFQKQLHEFDKNDCCKQCGYVRKYSKGLRFSINSDSVSYAVSIGSCLDKDVVIPGVYNGKPVTQIAPQAFYHCYNIESIYIPDSVTVINTEAFTSCNKLNSITLPSGLKTIKYRAFEYCVFSEITIPASVVEIQYWVFTGCYNLQRVYFENPNGWKKGLVSLSSEKLSDPILAFEEIGISKIDAFIFTRAED